MQNDKSILRSHVRYLNRWFLHVFAFLTLTGFLGVIFSISGAVEEGKSSAEFSDQTKAMHTEQDRKPFLCY